MRTEKLNDTTIHPIRIPTPFAVGDVFCYLIIDDKTVLVDTGHFAGNAFALIEENMGKYALDVRELDEIWLTHGHPDHYGQAHRLAEHSGAVLYGHRNERANFSGNNHRDLFEEFFNKHGIPQQYILQMLEQLKWLQQFQQPIEPEWIEHSDRLSSGELDAEVHLTPGHAPGHVTFATNQGIFFGGDLLLGHISTNALINFDADTGRRNKSLLQYRKSLKWMREQEGSVLPGHGARIDKISEVAEHHLQQHRLRYQQIRSLIEQQPRGLIELSYVMFPDAIEKGAVFLVLSEVLGYLDWGIEKDEIHLNETTMKYKIVTG